MCRPQIPQMILDVYKRQVEVLVYDKNGIKYEMAQNIVGALGELGFREIGVQARPGLAVSYTHLIPG